MGMSFASDNYSGCLPEIMQYLSEEVNHGHEPAYGADRYTMEAQALLKKEFGEHTSAFFVANGTAANVIALKHFVNTLSSVITADSSHLVNHETSAPYGHLGVKIITVDNKAGKITPEDIKTAYESETKWKMHASIPEVVSITQPTEFGTVYTIEEIQKISLTCKDLGLILHMDGCRLYNAAVSLNCSLAETSLANGVDVLSLGGTKNGLMYGEVIVFSDTSKQKWSPYFVKHMLNMQSKHRFLSSQFIPFLKNSLWFQAAATANRMANELAEKLQSLQLAEVIYPVESNQIFVKMSPSVFEKLNAVRSFYVFEEAEAEGLHTVRLVTSFDTTENDIKEFLSVV